MAAEYLGLEAISLIGITRYAQEKNGVDKLSKSLNLFILQL